MKHVTCSLPVGGTRHSIPYIILICLLGSAPAVGQEAAVPEKDSTPETEAEALDIIQQPFNPMKEPGEEPAPQQLEETEHDPCDWDLESPHIQEDSQEVVRSATCHSFRWFDGLFGEEIDYPEEQVNGLLTVGAEYTQYDKFDPRLRFRVRAPLPNMSSRLDLIVGRGDDAAFIEDTETQNQTFYNPGLVKRDTEDEWLLGLGNRRGRQRRGWDWSVGVRLGAPIDPYVKTQWFYFKSYSDSADLRFRQTFFWRNEDGFGSTSRTDYAWGVDPENVLRWEGVVTVSEETEGAKWYVGHTWYHLMEKRSAFSILAFARGETNAEVALNEYGLNFIWRRPFTREWMYLSMGPSVTWPRFFQDEKRELSLGFGAWIEMEFGDWTWYRR